MAWCTMFGVWKKKIQINSRKQRIFVHKGKRENVLICKFPFCFSWAYHQGGVKLNMFYGLFFIIIIISSKFRT